MIDMGSQSGMAHLNIDGEIVLEGCEIFTPYEKRLYNVNIVEGFHSKKLNLCMNLAEVFAPKAAVFINYSDHRAVEVDPDYIILRMTDRFGEDVVAHKPYFLKFPVAAVTPRYFELPKQTGEMSAAFPSGSQVSSRLVRSTTSIAVFDTNFAAGNEVSHFDLAIL